MLPQGVHDIPRYKKNNALFHLAELSSQFDSLPESDSISRVSRDRSSSPDRKSSSEKSLASGRPYSGDSSHPAEPPLRIRSRSPPARCMTTATMIASCKEIQYELDQLQFL